MANKMFLWPSVTATSTELSYRVTMYSYYSIEKV